MRDCFERCAALRRVPRLGARPAAGRRPLPRTPQSYEEALAKFAADSYNETDAAIAGVAASGNPLAAQVIEALQDGRLLFSAGDKKIYMREPPAGLLDAATGQPVAGAEPAGLKPGARQQPRAARHRGGPRQPDAAVARSRQAARGGAGGVQVEGRQCRCRRSIRAIDKETDARDEEGAGGSARGRSWPASRMRGRPTGSPPSRSCAIAAIRTRAACWRAFPAISRQTSRRRWPTPSPRSTIASPLGAWRRTSGTGSRSARCCCSPPSDWPSPSASWASSTWRTARW